MLRRFCLLGLLVPLFFVSACHNKDGRAEEEDDKYDGPGVAMKYEYECTKDPKTGIVPHEKLWDAIEYTEQLKQDVRGQMASAKTTITGWIERGPNSDAVGTSNGNTRGTLPGAVAAGRIRAMLVDGSDATGNTLWVGGVAGGLWKTTSLNSSPNWTFINDKFANLAITGICQNPLSLSTMYFCTGEGEYNADAVRGNGVFKSIDGGVTWTQLASTTSSTFYYCSKILCDAAGNVYVGTRSGLQRSINGGTSWTNITPTGVDQECADMAISATGRLHLTTGLYFSSTCDYRFTDNPSTVTSASGWTASTTALPTGVDRIVLACNGNNLVALPSDNATDDVNDIYKSSDGGVNWVATATTPAFTSGQGWYSMAAAINPSNTTEYIVGSLDCYKSTNSGTSWSAISTWVGAGQYVHADQHQILWYNAGVQNRVLVACDGGVFLSTDGGTTWADKNTGLRIKQFYSCAIHPAAGSNYILGGAQDNGCHSFSNSGLSSSVEVTGGDGAFVQIDQDQPQYQFGSYVYNDYRRSANSGSTWGSVTLSSSTGRFINPTDYDNVANIMYCGNSAGTYRRWTNPQSGNTNAPVTVTALNSSNVTAVSVSPYTANRVYFGTSGGRVVRVDAANTFVSGGAGVNVTGAISAGGTVSCIAIGTTEDTMMTVFSNYGVTSIWYTTNGTSGSPTWVAKEGALPDMPVRWAVFMPGRSKLVAIATETGVWFCNDINAAVPIWYPDPTFPTVSTHMVRIRPSDKTIVAATHGRGMWSADAYEVFQIALPLTEFSLAGNSSNQGVDLNWLYNTSRTSMKFDVEQSDNGVEYKYVTTVSGLPGRQTYKYHLAKPDGIIYYRIKAHDAYGLTEYCNSISFSGGRYQVNSINNLYPNPAKDKLFISLNSISDTKVRFNVYGLNGDKVYSGEMLEVAKGNQVMNIPVGQLAQGQYILEAVMDDQKLRRQFLKH